MTASGTAPHDGVSGAPTALTILVPGWPQWSWGQRERGLVLLGSYAAGMIVGLFAWGTPVGLLMLGFAFASHVVSMVDAIRQHSFPRIRGWIPIASSMAGLGLVYGTVLLAGLLVAWPAGLLAGPGVSYLVNTWAYPQGEAPRPGDYVWFEGTQAAGPRVARVLAGPGQEVGWTERKLRVDGVTAQRPINFRGPGIPDQLEFTVPPDHVLVSPDLDADPDGRSSTPDLVLIPTERVVGRAWAQLYPVWNRRLLL